MISPTLLSHLQQIKNWIETDVGNRGFARQPDNLLSRTPHDFAKAVQSFFSSQSHASDTNSGSGQESSPSRSTFLNCSGVAIVTGFVIPVSDPAFASPLPETDGPLGALFLAEIFTLLHIPVYLISDAPTIPSLHLGCNYLNLKQIKVVEINNEMEVEQFLKSDIYASISHLIAIERPGPNYSLEALQLQTSNPELLATFSETILPEHQNQIYSMRGICISSWVAPLHLLFQKNTNRITIGIGDGGNEIGMGKIPWSVIRNNIARGDKIACAVDCDYTIVAGVSNWGGYALGCAIALLARTELGIPETIPWHRFEAKKEFDLIDYLVKNGNLIDGVSGKNRVSVDGLDIDSYLSPLIQIEKLLQNYFTTNNSVHPRIINDMN